MKNLFLDDERHPVKNYEKYLSKLYNCFGDLYITEQWEIVRNYNQFCEWILDNGLPDRISFDNDLGVEKEGYDCVKWLGDYCMDNGLTLNSVETKYHTANTVAAENMSIYIKNFKVFTNGKV